MTMNNTFMYFLCFSWFLSQKKILSSLWSPCTIIHFRCCNASWGNFEKNAQVKFINPCLSFTLWKRKKATWKVLMWWESWLNFIIFITWTQLCISENLFLGSKWKVWSQLRVIPPSKLIILFAIFIGIWNHFLLNQINLQTE